MAQNLAYKIMNEHLAEGKLQPGEEMGLRIDQTLTQDATGTLVMLEFEAMQIPRVQTELSAQYVDHNLIQSDYRNPDDHLFLRSACRKFGLWYSQPGNGVSHPVHMERFGVPGKTLLGSDSHTCAAGSLGMLAIGAGGLEVATAMAGEPFHIKTPTIMGVKLTGELPAWVSAKDVILEMLRRHDVDGGLGKIIEYYGPGLAHLTAMDRHVIANMGAELGATTSLFPSDEQTRAFMRQQGREEQWIPLAADEGAPYDEHDEIDLSQLEPLIAKPSSPGNVVPVREEVGQEIYQTYIGSSANPGLRDFAVPALMVEGQNTHDRVSFDVNPTSRQILENMTEMNYLSRLLHSGARLHQAGCNGCIGMGQAPASESISLRTVPRNFPGRSGTREDRVYLCSPETATASALTGEITDPRTLDREPPRFEEPETLHINTQMLTPPAESNQAVTLDKGPNINKLPHFDPMPETIEGPVLMKVGDDISTDEIMPAGSKVLPFRSNIPMISKFVFNVIDENYYDRAMQYQQQGSLIVGGENYGQGSSREHAALAPRYLGVRTVIAKSFARIHWQNLVNFGILPLNFCQPDDWQKIDQGDELALAGIDEGLASDGQFTLHNKTKNADMIVCHNLSPRQIEILRKGSLINLIREKAA